MFMGYPKITFRPTPEMYRVIESVRKELGLTQSEVMRNIVSDYMLFLKKNGKR
jgi:hypothetical protein